MFHRNIDRKLSLLEFWKITEMPKQHPGDTKNHDLTFFLI